MFLYSKDIPCNPLFPSPPVWFPLFRAGKIGCDDGQVVRLWCTDSTGGLPLQLSFYPKKPEGASGILLGRATGSVCQCAGVGGSVEGNNYREFVIASVAPRQVRGLGIGESGVVGSWTMDDGRYPEGYRRTTDERRRRNDGWWTAGDGRETMDERPRTSDGCSMMDD